MLPPDPDKPLPRTVVIPEPPGPPGEAGPEAPAVPPAAVTAPPGLGTMLHALRRCWFWAVPLAALGGVLAALLSLYFYPGSYSSSVVFRILVRPAHGSQEDEGHFSNVQKAQVALMTSHEVLAEAIGKSGVAERYGVQYTPASLGKKLTATFNTGPEVMHVALTGDNPEAITALLNALGEVYPSKVAAMEEARVKTRIAQLRRRLDSSGDRRDPGRALTLAEQLHDKRNELLKAEKDAGLDKVAALRSRHNDARQLLSSSTRDLGLRKQELSGLRARVKAGEFQVRASPVSDADVKEALARDADFKEAEQHIATLEGNIALAEKKYTGRALENATARDRKHLSEWIAHRARLVRFVRQQLVEKQQQLAREAQEKADAQARAQEAFLENQVAALQHDVKLWTREVEDTRGAGDSKVPAEVEALRDQVKQLEKEYNEVGTQVAALEGSLPLPPRVTRHAEALVPQEREVNRSHKVALAIGVLTFLGVAAGLCLLEATGKRVYSSGDVQQGLGMRILGTLPRLPASARRKTAAAQTLGGLDARYGMNEAIDALRTVLMNSPRNDGARVILVTSAIGGEGKTTLASHLAASLARAWRKTLLIDGDLRKPALNAQFDLPLQPGLSEALRGEIEFDDCIKPTTMSRLWVMPAGKVDGHSLQALAQEGLGSVFEQLKEHYDFIVLDTSPVLLVPDGLLLAQQADLTVLSVLKDHSRIPAVYAAQQKLEALGIRVAGTVLIGEKTEAYGYSVPYPRQGA
jgi:capsular exopolysaccharide synthesis family protein